MQLSNESGRSMLEILLVLAVIGLLSVGGVILFKEAINRLTAERIIESVSVADQDMQLGKTPRFLTVSDTTFNTLEDDKGKPVFITVDITNKDVCKNVKNMASGVWVIEGDCE